MAKKKGEDVKLPPGYKLDPRGTRYYDIVDPADPDRLLIRVGHYHDPDPREPEGFARLMDFLPIFTRQVNKGKWASFLFDSVSFAYLSARKYSQYDLNEDANDPRQHYGLGVDLLEEILCMQLPALPCNVGVAMHVSKTKVEAEGEMVRAPLAPGRLLNNVAGAWPELYRVYVEKGDPKKIRRFQTDSDERWQAGSLIGAPDGMRIWRKDPSRVWEDVWSNWTAKGPRPWWHGILYGEPHIGKSTALRMLPTPIYAAVCDSLGKDFPYRMMGELKIAA